ncbi:hypothetical protein LCGC14_2641240, partial [marine sediment metagenome]
QLICEDIQSINEENIQVFHPFFVIGQLLAGFYQQSVLSQCLLLKIY